MRRIEDKSTCLRCGRRQMLRQRENPKAVCLHCGVPLAAPGGRVAYVTEGSWRRPVVRRRPFDAQDAPGRRRRQGPRGLEA